MIVDCPSCGATYNISDDKVRGRRVRVRCKTCGEGIVVDGAALDDATRVYSPSFEPAAYSEDRDESTRVMSAGGPEWREPGPDDWTVNLSETEQRTMSNADLVSAYRSGEIGEDAYVWRDGMGDWLPIGDVPEIRAAIESSEATRVMSPAAVRAAAGPPPRAASSRAALNEPTIPTDVTYAAPAAPPRALRAEAPSSSVEYAPFQRQAPPPARAPAAPALAPAAPAPQARVREQRARADLFGGGGGGGGPRPSEDHLLASSSMPLEQYEEKPTGARNESSVLFSLNALKAGAGRGGPMSAPPRMLAASPPTAADILGMSAGGALPGMDTTAALLSAPVVEAPPPAAALPPKRDRMDTTPPTKRAKQPVVLIGAVVGLALVVAGGVFFVVKSRVAPSAAGSAQPSATAAVTAAPTPTPPPPAAPTPPPAPKAEEAPAAPVAAAPEPVAPTPAPAGPTPAAPAPQRAAPAGGSSNLEAMKAAMKPEKAAADTKSGGDKGTKVVLDEEPAAKGAAAPAEEAPAEEAPKPPFDTGAAKAALAGAAGNAANCKKPDGPTGSGKVTVTFSPSGRATSANVTEGPFGGTPVGGCIAKLFRAAKVPAFSGDPVTVSKGFSIPE